MTESEGRALSYISELVLRQALDLPEYCVLAFTPYVFLFFYCFFKLVLYFPFFFAVARSVLMQKALVLATTSPVWLVKTVS